MDRNRQEQNEPQQGQSSGGFFSQGVNAINGLARRQGGIPNPFGKIGTKVVLQAGRSLLVTMLTNPIFLAVLTVFVFTLILVFVFAPGAPGLIPEASNQMPTITPAEPE